MNHSLSSSQRSSHPQSGFTLIELLVVISIIAILAAILFPVFASAREKARQNACLSNEKQIGTAVMQYVQDFDEVLPRYYDGNNASNHAKWIDGIYPYINSAQVFTCPSSIAANTNKSDNIYQPNITLRTGNNQDDFGSYGCNASYYGGSGTTAVTATSPFPGTTSTAVSKLLVPSSTIMITERWLRAVPNTPNGAIGWSNGSTNPSLDLTQKIPALTVPGGTAQTVSLLHNTGANVIWCDGHVKWIPGRDLLLFRHYGSKDIMYYWTIEED